MLFYLNQTSNFNILFWRRFIQYNIQSAILIEESNMKTDLSNDQSDSLCQQEDDEVSVTQLEQSFMSACSQNMEEKTNSAPQFRGEVPRSIQVMFILFSFYQDDIANVGLNFNCKTKIALNKIKIFSEISQRDVERCQEMITKYLQKLVYTELNHDNKFKVLYSPYFKKKAGQMGFKMCKFNSQIYCHTRIMEQKQLKKIMKDLFSGHNIFTVDIKFKRAKDRDIYKHLRSFVKKMKEHYAQQCKKREVFVELDESQNTVNCIGTKQRDLVAIKNTFKNLLQSTVIMIFKFSSYEGMDKKVQTLKKYTQKVSTFYVEVAKIEKKALTVISKQNIIRKLLQKDNFKKIINFDDKTQIGMFISRKYNYNDRKMMIQDVCRKKGYDFTTLGGIYHYFKKMFIQQDQQTDPQQLLRLIEQILNEIKQGKDKFDIPQHIQSYNKAQKQIQITAGEYYSIGDISRDDELSNLLKRDVMREKLRMSKTALVRYNVVDAEQSGPVYWYEDGDKNKIMCQMAEMKPRIDYFCGKIKKLGTQIYYFIQSKILLI